MYICICNAVTDKQLLDAQKNSNHSIDQVIQKLGVGSCCGSCLNKAEDLLLENAGVKTFNPVNFTDHSIAVY